ncbi:MAG: rhodanese-like domain-containing protein, partial [Akkermansiaceae bacterium]|nr:rhodanese-like domain-containing protein [Akkermansiaceae bacterium]
MHASAQLAVIAAMALAAAGGTWLVKGPPQRWLSCDPAMLQPDELCLSQIPAGSPVVWVDARPRSEWKKNGMAGSVLWNLDPAEDMQAFEAELALQVIETPRVVVYCGDENCGVSRQVAGRIRAMGLGAEVFVLHGGWRALAEAGRVTYSSP